MSFEQLQDDSNFSKEPAPCFILMNNYFEKLKSSTEMSIYAQISYLHEQQLPIFGKEMDEFCSKMNISAEDMELACDHLKELGYLNKGN